ncbi:hypothetical protein Y919_03430 [Caloranaerobacter azorensis H53214]|uniref:Uncharacterized protein n=1 Tax=Caloranaerobacter azorensis H53214 TaxID=1156417 RepID=A0A096CWM6_9FIRM|nr:hypothetical protein [Caloranaerobacter azorensis]KGG80969.1 hypothetical protein Y919_03430 [Caloranaerobacter azorensis H53214]
MDVSLLDAIREMLKEELKPINERLDSVGDNIKGMNKRLETVELEISGIKEEHGLLLRSIEEKLQIQSKAIEKIEFIEGDIKAIRKDIDKMKKDIYLIELVTAKNWVEINELKAAK